MMAPPIRVLVADDSGFMRAYLKEILGADRTIDVIGSAANGKDAVEKTALHKPDVVVMDMEMGEYDGCYGIEHIMRSHPVPIVILSAVGNSDFTRIEKGLKLGAVDYV